MSSILPCLGLVRMDTSDLILRFVPPKFRAGFVLFGGLFAMLSYGSVYTFGNMLPYMVSYFRWKVDPHMTAGRMIWLQTLMSGLPFAMLVGGLLERRMGGRNAAILGSTLYTGAIAATYFTIQHSFAAVLISMGFISSFGGAIAYNSILTTAQRWLPDSVGLAGGLIVGGYGCGAFILAPLQTAFINPYDYRVNKDGYFTQEDLLEKVPYVFIVMAVLFTLLQIMGLFFLGSPNEELNIETENIIVDNREITVGTQLRSSTFILLFCSLALNALWVQIVSGLYKTFGQQFIDSDLFLSFIGSLASICNAVSRISWGCLVDNTSYQACMAMVTVFGAALMWLLPVFKIISNDIVFLSAVCGMFCCIGGTYSLFPYITHRCFGKTNFSVVYGFLQCALSVAGIMAGLLSQFVLPLIGFNYLFLLVGFSMLISFILTTVLHCTDMAPLNQYVAIPEDGHEHEHPQN